MPICEQCKGFYDRWVPKRTPLEVDICEECILKEPDSTAVKSRSEMKRLNIMQGKDMDEGVYSTQAEKDKVDAERWRCLIGSDRVRVLGSAGLGSSGYQHIGIELWSDYPDREGLSESNDFSRKQLTTYVDALRSRG